MAAPHRRAALLLLVLALVGLRPVAAAPASSTPAPATTNGRLVLVISVDGLTPKVIGKLGPSRLPHLHRLLRQGASTRNARAQPELTDTLPNHTSMVTGRRIDAAYGGHGVTWNHDARGRTVRDGAGGPVASVFTEVDAAGGSTAVFATKSKFSLFRRTWPGAVHTSVVREGKDAGVTFRLRRHLRRERPAFSLLHLGGPDRAGHDHRWMGPQYRRAVQRADRLVGTVLATRDASRALRQRLRIVLTSDHGGVPWRRSHADPRRLANHRVPFVVHGRGVARGENLYRLSRGYRRPGRAWRPATGVQPIRNGDVANLALSLLGLGPVPGSQWGTEQRLAWR
ncbi:alkaline phosphatase family protein [Nocardioides panacisoli]|uniref:alkaline phosphatase family protein n=1 Tax=Nocardioides panacisoli TaxID=627624 RepID=UPI001C625344|nr:alkaline phosphatase family protein [Nocardioides panacisoli]QYJ04283.1 alkaline phosphatase family protein [Nocardioides panacisoli]